MSSSPVTGPSAELIRYAHGSTRIARTCTPCVTPVFPATRGSAHRPRSARIGCPACMNGNSSNSPEKESATARPDRDPLTASVPGHSAGAGGNHESAFGAVVVPVRADHHAAPVDPCGGGPGATAEAGMVVRQRVVDQGVLLAG